MGTATISAGQLTQQLGELGVTAGGVLLVHCAFSKVNRSSRGQRV
jgi:aminoglycoside N3'-acetyltransferase